MNRRPIFTVLMTDGPLERLAWNFIQREVDSRFEPRLASFLTGAHLVRWTREKPFSFVLMNLSNARMASDGEGLTRSVRRLRRIRSTYVCPIVVFQGRDLARDFAGTGITFLQVPFEVEDLVRVLP